MSGAERGAIVVADGDAVEAGLAAARASLPGGALVIAADGGAAKALAAGILPDLVVGDGDSLSAATRAELGQRGVPILAVPMEKDESDTELALRAALERGARTIRIVGALGGPRVEHALANLFLLAHPDLDGVDVAIVAPPSTIRRIGSAAGPGTIHVEGAPGDHLSLLPLAGPVEGVVTEGLRYPLRDEPLLPGPARGLSNALIGTRATVSVRRGCLLVIRTPRTEDAAS